MFGSERGLACIAFNSIGSLAIIQFNTMRYSTADQLNSVHLARSPSLLIRSL